MFNDPVKAQKPAISTKFSPLLSLFLDCVNTKKNPFFKAMVQLSLDTVKLNAVTSTGYSTRYFFLVFVLLWGKKKSNGFYYGKGWRFTPHS
jgi:hypothetical protein